MTDFTKEELETIHVWSRAYTEWLKDLSQNADIAFHSSLPLIKKIQSMLDNIVEKEYYAGFKTEEPSNA
jgi:hypothetical protein